MTPALLHKIDLRGYDDSFCETVRLNSNEYFFYQFENPNLILSSPLNDFLL